MFKKSINLYRIEILEKGTKNWYFRELNSYFLDPKLRSNSEIQTF